MKINLLFPLLFFIFFTSCDERKTVESLTPAVVLVTKTKTELISRKWFIPEIYYIIDGKKTIIAGVGAATNLTATVSTSPNNYFTFSKDGKLEVYTEDKKGVPKTENGTWKFLNNETQVQLLYGVYDYKLDIPSLSDKEAEVVTPKIVMATLGSETDTNKQIALGGALVGLINDKTKEVKFGMKFGVK